jgi:hypothetical protein
MKQERVAPAQRKKTEATEVDAGVSLEDRDAGLLNNIDDLLDEIDAVLEDQAILVEFRQRSGQ